MGDRPFDLHQNIFKEHHPAIRVIPCHENDLDEKILGSFLAVTGNNIGVAPIYGAKCALSALAFASLSQVLLIRLSSHKSRTHKQASGARKLLRDSVFCRPDLAKFALRMDRFAVALYLDLSLRITSGVDLLSVAEADRQSLEAIMFCLGGEVTLHRANVIKVFKQDEKNTPAHDVALQAWAACRAGTLVSIASRLEPVPRITTKFFGAKKLLVLAKTLRDTDRLVALKPIKTRNEVDAKFSHKQGKVNLTSTRFNTRVMPTNRNQTLEITTTSNGKYSTVSGRATKVNGRGATVSLNGILQGHTIRSVTTIGREDPTSAEHLRAKIVLLALQRSITILEQPFVQGIWLPSITPSWGSCSLPSRVPVTLHFPSPRILNNSQTKAVEAILSNHNVHRIQLIHGPPGTGKTTVIAASVTSVAASANPNRTLWLVAQSNVAVKNIAEKLAAVKFIDFKLIVSKDFHFDWHEHLYQKICANVIRSDDLNLDDDLVGTERLLLGSKVILCTLSMLSNNKLASITRLVPVETVIFDEASQIEIGDYFPMLFRFQTTLRKLVFIGDDKQLPPFGESDIDDLQSIFEMPHLRNRAIFLDTQYRMPTPIGTFISQNVYENQLKSIHAITTKSSCRFVDVHNGKEVQMNHSWMNLKEIQVVMALARKYHAQHKSYRIITPYDAQRSKLEIGLKAEKLPWKDKCFNVDSFQGNEDDHIIISIVRSDKIGFLREFRRVNVMLTRCKKSMVICTSRAFVEGIASSSLVGALAMALGSQSWLDLRQVFV